MTSGSGSGPHKEMELVPTSGRDEELHGLSGPSTRLNADEAKSPILHSPSNERTPLLPVSAPVPMPMPLTSRPPRAVRVTAYSPPPSMGHFDFSHGEAAEDEASGMLVPIILNVPRSLPAGSESGHHATLDYGTTMHPVLHPAISEPGHVHHHSILRANSARTLVPHRTIRKSASVEFRLAHEDEVRHIDRTRRPSLGREFPRRLTNEEKEELYRVRPDLEIGPVPFFQEQIEEMKRQSQRRMLFAIFGGMFSMLLLMIVYYVLTKKYKKKISVGIKHTHSFGMMEWDA